MCSQELKTPIEMRPRIEDPTTAGGFMSDASCPKGGSGSHPARCACRAPLHQDGRLQQGAQ